MTIENCVERFLIVNCQLLIVNKNELTSKQDSLPSRPGTGRFGIALFVGNNPEWWEIGNTLAPYSRYLLKEYIAESHRGIFDLKQLRLMIDLCSTGATVGMLDCMISIRIIAGRESAYWSIRFTRRTDWRQKRWSYWLNMLFLI